MCFLTEQTTVVTVHGLRPHFFFPLPRNARLDDEDYLPYLVSVLEQVGQAAGAVAPVVVGLEVVRRTSIYGYHSEAQLFCRVDTAKPKSATILAETLASRFDAPIFHAHLPFFLQAIVNVSHSLYSY